MTLFHFHFYCHLIHVTLFPSTDATTIIIDGGQQVIVNGTLTLIDTTITTIQIIDQTVLPIVVSGSIVLDGSLQLELQETFPNGTILPIISGTGEINGTFDTIQVIPFRECEDVSGSSVDVSNGVGVLLNVDVGRCERDKGGLDRGAIAGIIVGCIVGVALIVVIAGVLLYRHKPSSPLFRTRDDEYVVN